MTTPDDDAFQTAAETLNRLVGLAAEGDTGEPDLHATIGQLDRHQLETLAAVAAAVIATDQHRDTTMLNHAATTNRTLRATHDRYLQALRHILATTASPQVRRTVTDALTSP